MGEAWGGPVEAPFDVVMDPVTLEVCWNRLIGIVNEQAAALQRTSFTSVVREAGDLSAGVFDRRGWMVAPAVTGTPGHINSMAPAPPPFLFASPCHAIDIGGPVLSAEAREVYEEGLFIPIMKLYEAGKPNETLTSLIRANTRAPEPGRGGLRGP